MVLKAPLLTHVMARPHTTFLDTLLLYNSIHTVQKSMQKVSYCVIG